MRRIGSLLLLTAGIAPLPTPAAAQSNENGRAAVAIIRPFTLVKTQDLDFGTLFPAAGAGQVTINPNTNALTTTGGIIAQGSQHHAAEFTGGANRWALIVIRVPTQPVTLQRQGGPGTMTASNFTLQGSWLRVVNGIFSFRVGATLNVPANAAEGNYEGTFTVTANYY